MTDIEIAKNAKLKHIRDIYSILNIHDNEVEYYGDYKAKIKLDIFKRLETRSNGVLVLVTSMTPTKKGEGKSTVTIGLTQAFNVLNYSSIATLRQPSMGPVFGIKGGATGGGYAQVLPMEDINLNFTGDFHAITAANNLIAAAIDNHIYWGNQLNIDINNIYFNRVIDTNDRALRNIQIIDKKYTRLSSFKITVASEIMAVLCLSESIQELKEKIGKIVVAKNIYGKLITVKDLKVQGATTAILKDAIKPNLVQTIENTPVFIHGGPFANIAHGCCSILATKLALKLCDYTITEAGFAADLGAEKFFDIKCRLSNITPDIAVLVVTHRAIEQNGFDNVRIHVENLRKYNVPIVMAVNKFNDDTIEQLEKIKEFAKSLNVPFCIVDSYSKGSVGAINLAKIIINEVGKKDNEANEVDKKSINTFNYLYPLDMPIKDKIEKLAREIYRATDVHYEDKALKKLEFFKDKGIDNLPICISKTSSSITDDPKLINVPEKYTFKVSDINPSFGAGFVVVIAGGILDMPGLPKEPNANIINITDDGKIEGLS